MDFYIKSIFSPNKKVLFVVIPTEKIHITGYNRNIKREKRKN